MTKQVLQLLPGAVIGVAAVGSPLHPDRVSAGLQELQRRGFTVKVPIDPSTNYGKNDCGFTCATAQKRALALMDLFTDPEVRLILAARGAYGCLDLLELLDFSLIGTSGKALVGCSDVSVLLAQSLRGCQMYGVHGPTLGSSFADASTLPEAKHSVDALFRLLGDPQYRFKAKCAVLNEGEGKGPVLAGNLSMLVSLLGTRWDVDYTGVMLVLEEVGEAPYRVQRMFTQLKLANKLDKLAGLVFGRFSKCEAAHGPKVEEVLENVIADVMQRPNYPVLSGLPVGHWGENQPLALGCQAEIKGDSFQVLESPICRE